jgi:hypothetical protein
MPKCPACGTTLSVEVCLMCESAITLRNTPIGEVVSCAQWCSLGPETQARCRSLTNELQARTREEQRLSRGRS